MSLNIVSPFKIAPPPITEIGGWIELGRTTVGTPSPDISVSGLADKRYYQVLINAFNTANRSSLRFNADAGSIYADRFSLDGAVDTPETNQNRARFGTSTSNPEFSVNHIVNLAANEKLIINQYMTQGAAGAANSPGRSEAVGKWTNTVDSINEIILHSLDGQNYTAGTEVVVLGWDPTDVHTTNFWEQLASVNATGLSTNLSATISARKYLWVQCYLKNTTSHVSDMTFNNDTTVNYANRINDNGQIPDPAPITSASRIEMFGATTTPIFVNMFIINNSANEKLVTGQIVNQNTLGAGTFTNRREFAAKWTNVASQITEIDLDSTVGNWDSASIMNVWGSN